MGSAMLSGWREQGLAASVAVDPAPDAARIGGPGSDRGAGCRRDPGGFRAGGGGARGEAAERRRDIAAVSRASPGRRCFCRSWPAGPSAACASLLGDAAAIVRAMPNTPAAVRQGVTVACPGAGVDDAAARAVRAAAAGDRRGGLGGGRGAARSGHGGVRQRAGLRVPAGRTDGAGGDASRASRPIWRGCWRGRRCPAPARCWPPAPRTRRRCASRSPVPAAPPSARSPC